MFLPGDFVKLERVISMTLKENFAKITRESILRNFSAMCGALGMDGSLTPDENAAELLRRCLFDDADLVNPMTTFKHDAEAGAFNPLDESEDPDHLPEWREPLTDEEFMVRKADILRQGRFWHGKRAVKTFELVAALIMELEPGEQIDSVTRAF